MVGHGSSVWLSKESKMVVGAQECYNREGEMALSKWWRNEDSSLCD